MWAAVALAQAPSSWGSSMLEQSAVCPQAADPAIAGLVTVTTPAASSWISIIPWQTWIYRDILGYLKWISDVDISGYWKDKCFGYPKDILGGYFIWIQTDIPGCHMDIIHGYELDIP